MVLKKVVYDKNGIRIDRYDCGTAGVCYQLNMESDASMLGVINKTIIQRSFTTEEMKELVADLVELRIGREKSDDKVKLIRRRKSYKMFASYAEKLKTEVGLTSEQIEKLLDIYYANMNEAYAYGSERNANLAYESLQQLKEDLRRGEKQ